MSLGFVDTHAHRHRSTKRHGAVSVEIDTLPLPDMSPRRSGALIFILLLLLAQIAFNLVAMYWVGIVLKWPITLGDRGHRHPHVPSEEYIWRPNQYLNILFVGFGVDFGEAIFLLFFLCMGKLRKKPPSNDCPYGCCRYLSLLWSFIGVWAIGGVASGVIALSMSRVPSLVSPPSPPPVTNGDFYSLMPPAAPLPLAELWPESDQNMLYVWTSIVSVLKLSSYMTSTPQRILHIPIESVYGRAA